MMGFDVVGRSVAVAGLVLMVAACEGGSSLEARAKAAHELYYDEGDSEAAVAALTALIEERPQYAGAHFMLAEVHEEEERYEEALQSYETAVQHDSEFAMAWLGKSSALSMLGREDEAKRASEEAYRLEPKLRPQQIGSAIMVDGRGFDYRPWARLGKD